MRKENKTIALNTGILYIKLILSIVIGLYSSRLVLLALGVSDYGLYSVVGGIVFFLNTISITMTSTSSRYISVEIGKGSNGNINKVYNTIFVIHIILALAFLLIALIFGTFYIRNYLNVIETKRPDALYVFYVSVLTTIISVICYPANGLIVAREKFIYTSTIEILQLLLKIVIILFILIPYGGNKLRLYAMMMGVVQLLQSIAYFIYCYKKEPETLRWHFNNNLKDYKEIAVFTWWLFCGAICVIGNNQGAAVVMNLFFGTVVNAAFGIAIQVQNYIQMFVRNLSQATAPQIMKSYGAGNSERSIELVYRICKYCFLIMLAIAMPLMISIKEVLRIWLDKVPEFTDIFIVLLVINGLIGCLHSGFDSIIQASGKIRFNQIGYFIINISLLPIIYILYKLGLPCYFNVVVMMILSLLTLTFQCYILKRISSFKSSNYWTFVIFPCVKVLIFSLLTLCLCIYNPTGSIMSLFFNTFISVVWVIMCIVFLGLDFKEKLQIKKIIINKLKIKQNG